MKSRLTITLSQSTLDKIDSLVDKKNIRNRSHAIEHLIEKGFKPSVSTAVLLAGGKTKKTSLPKPLTLIDEKPLIIHTLELLRKYQVSRVIITTDQIVAARLKKTIGKGSSLGLEIEYVTEKKPLGTAGAIKAISNRLPAQPFFVIYGDILTTINLDELLAFHTKHKGLITMAVKPRATRKSFDNVFVQGHTVVDFQTNSGSSTVNIVNAGVYIFDPSALHFIPDKQPAMLEQDVFPKLVNSKQILAFPFQGAWFDVDTDANYQKALKKP